MNILEKFVITATSFECNASKTKFSYLVWFPQEQLAHWVRNALAQGSTDRHEPNYQIKLSQVVG
jgi:hypothetical protein